ncbi:hypothetical protein GCM10023066_33540 [Nocardioides kongjuensis]
MVLRAAGTDGALERRYADMLIAIIVVVAVLMVAATIWWLRELRKGPVIESPDSTLREAQHREG